MSDDVKIEDVLEPEVIEAVRKEKPRVAAEPVVIEARVVDAGGGMKSDAGKVDLTMLPWDALESVSRVLEFGARKYARDNWRKLEKERVERSLKRHIKDYFLSKLGLVPENDPETGLPQSWHIATNGLFLVSLELRDALAAKGKSNG
jgi:hypothetical protein